MSANRKPGEQKRPEKRLNAAVITARFWIRSDPGLAAWPGWVSCAFGGSNNRSGNTRSRDPRLQKNPAGVKIAVTCGTESLSRQAWGGWVQMDAPACHNS